MKRPFALIGFTYLFILIAASYLNTAATAAMAVFLALCAALTVLCLKFYKHWRELTMVLCTAAVAFAAYNVNSYFRYEPAAALDSKQAEVYGTVVDLPVYSGNAYYYVIQTDKIVTSDKTVAMRTKIRMKAPDKLSAQPYDQIDVKVGLYLPEADNGLGYDSRSYYRSKGIYLFASQADTPKVKSAGRKPLGYYALITRQYISAAVMRCVWGTQGALADGILIGDVSELPASVKADFTTTGISHLLAVSGTQTSLITQYILLLLCFFRVPKRIAALFSAGAVTFFMAITGFSPSVTRAGIMSLLYLAGLIIRMEPDALNSLGLSVLLLCLPNSYAATDTGLLLSFAATLGMITCSQGLLHYALPPLKRLPRGLGKVFAMIAGILCETIGASLLTLPIIMLTFRQVSLVTLIANMIEVPVSLFVTLATALIAILAPVGIFIVVIKPIALLIRIAAAFMIWTAHLLASIPYASVSTSYGFLNILLLFALVLVLVYYFYKRKGASLKICAVCFIFTFVIGITSYSIAANGVLEVVSLPVENGSSTVIMYRGSALVLDLSGSEANYATEQYLKSRNTRQVDALILPAFDQSRVNQANILMDDFETKSVYLPGAYKCDENSFAGFITQKSEIIWHGVRIIMIPSTDRKNMIVQMTYGSSRILLTGNIDADLNRYNITGSEITSDALVFGGSVTKTFAKSVSPAYASGGESGDAVFAGATLQTMGCTVQNTYKTGKVTLLTRGNGLFKLSKNS